MQNLSEIAEKFAGEAMDPVKNTLYDKAYTSKSLGKYQLHPIVPHKGCKGCPPDQPHVGGDKFNTKVPMTDSYEKLMKDFRDQPIRLLEIGVFRGESLAVWSEYFHHPDTVIFGIDGNINAYFLSKERLRSKGAWSNANKVVVKLGDATDRESMEKLMKNEEKFDFIIDDGCHATDCILKTMDIFMPYLKPTGTYVIEDNFEVIHKIKPLWQDGLGYQVLDGRTVHVKPPLT
jgi:hypothetical protein